MSDRYRDAARLAALVVPAVAGGFTGPQYASAAQFTYTSQTRSASVEARGVITVIGPPATNTPTTDLKSASAPDFGAFSADLSATASNAPFDPDSYASARQTSSLLPTEVRMVGDVGGADNQPAYVGSGRGLASSVLLTTFTLDVASPYFFTFDAQRTLAGGGAASGYRARLTGPGGSVFDYTGTLAATDRVNPTQLGALVAGTYTLDVRFDNGGTGAGTSFGANRYSLVFNVPEPASLALLGAAGLLPGRRRERHDSARRAVR